MPDWYSDHDELVAFATELDAAGAFNETSDVVRFFEKPWKWTPERARWIAEGKPTYSRATEDAWDRILDH